ncbi:MAG: response regulator transcription factor [Chloroflexi bacterium]|nr:response regulator transcription factor [Chloroflexota bacterium]
MAASILLIEKAKSPIDWIFQSLEKKGYTVSLARGKQKAIQQATSETPDLIILNATSPQVDGPKICHTLHEKVGEIPIILILAAGERDDDVVGATVILIPPFTPRKLFNRIKWVLTSGTGKIMQAGGLALKLGTHCVDNGCKEWRLTPKEFELLKVFMRSPGRVLSRKFLMKKVWKTDYMGDTRTLDVHIRWLREKIEENPSSPTYLRTVRGVGYRFDIPEEANEETERKT